MASMMLAIIIIVAGAAVVVVGPTVANRGRAKLLGYGLMLGGVAAAGMNAVIVVGVGEVGVKHFLGRVDRVPLEQGVHVINPLASVERMSVREQSYPESGASSRSRPRRASR